MVTTLNSLQHLHQYRIQIVTRLKTTPGLSTTLSTHNSKPLFLNSTARPSWGDGGVGPAADDRHVPETYQRDRKKTSRGPVYYISETGRRHPGDQFIIHTRQAQDTRWTSILYKRDRQKPSRGPVSYINETGKRHPEDRNTVPPRQAKDI